jgi:hypothetical protein
MNTVRSQKMIDKKALINAIYFLESNNRHMEAEEVQNLLDLADIAIDSIHKIEKIKVILEIEDTNESD